MYLKAMILAAGTGTRLRPLTDNKPKALIEVNNIAMLEHQINYLMFYGVNEIIINIHHFGEQIKNFINQKKFNIRIEFSDELDQLLDTGGGLKKASWFFDDGKPFFLLGADIYTDLNLTDLLDYHKKFNPIATVAVKKRNSTRDFMIDENNILCGWRNNLTGEEIFSRKSDNRLTNYGFSVIHVINPDIFNLIEETEPFTMTSLYMRLVKNNIVMAYPHNQDEWFEFGRLENFYNQAMLQKADRIQRIYLRGNC